MCAFRIFVRGWLRQLPRARQQDALLHAVENGTLTLIGATTENPSFEVTGALLSRSRVLVLNQLTETDISLILQRALTDKERGLGELKPEVPDESIKRIAHSAAGDARVALTALEAAVEATAAGDDGIRKIT